MFPKRVGWLGWLGVFLVLAAVGSGLLLAQSPQAVGTWVGVGSANNPFGNGASVDLTDGRTLIVGGSAPDGVPTNVVASFDTETHEFAIAGTLLSARTEHTATLLKDGRVLVTGGITNGLVSTDIELFDPSTGASTLVAQMAEPRRGHVAALLQNGSVLIAGGYTTENVVLQSAFVFDPVTNSVSPTPIGMNVARASASATTMIDGRVVIIGGTNDGTNDLRSAEIFDPTLQSFTNVSTLLSVPLRGHSAVLLPHNGSVLVAGGTSRGAAQAGADLFLPTQFPDPFSWGVGQFAPTGAMSFARSSAIAGPTATEGYAVATGGGSNSAERYRFATIKTDKDDYPPGQRALITGAGWEPNEEVKLLFQEDPAVHEDYELTVTARADGTISHDQWAPEQHDANVRFYLMAIGQQSGRRAQITFTDSQPQAVSVGTPTSVTVAAGATASYGTVSVTMGGNSGNCTVTLGLGTQSEDTGLPASATPNFNNSPFTTNANFTSTFSLTTGATPPATYTFRVTATRGSDCQSSGGGNAVQFSNQLTLVVTNANTPPVITEGASVGVTMSEDGSPNPFSLTLNATDGEDNTLTWSISTAATHGTASASGNGTSKVIGYTPASNYNGSDSFVVQVSDGNGGTDTITVNVAIAAVNDQPSFTAANPAAVNEDSGAQTVSSWASFQAGGGTDENSQTAMYVVSNVGNPALFTSGPVVSANGTLTYTPAPNAFGTSTFDVFVEDSGGTANGGANTSTTQQFMITVNGVNDAPSFTGGGNVTSNEDSAYNQPWATAISAGPNESGQVLTFSVTGNNNTALFSVQPAISSGGTLTYTPTANATGAASIEVRLSDNGGNANGGSDLSGAVTFTITVNGVNDAPSFTKGDNVTVLEDSPAYSAGWATQISAGPANESGQTVAFTVTNSENSLFSVQPSIAPGGTLTFTPAPNAFGTATVTVTLKDNGGTANTGVDTSAAQTFTITVTGVNDAPSFTSGAAAVTVNEDSGAYNTTWATAISAGPNEGGQTLTFTVSNNNNALFSSQPAISATTGVLTFTPTADAFGTATVTVTLKDDGGTANNGVDSSATVTFTITVDSVNDAPSFTSGGAVSVNEDSGAYSAGWATAISAGPANESAQALTFSATNDNNGLFLVQPSISATGVLTFTPAANAFGTATVSVTLKDDGGTANGGVDTTTKTLTISVNPVNDAPTNLLLSRTPISISEGGSTTLNGSFADAETTDAHTVLIEWGDTGATTTLSLGAGMLQFTATHTYPDDNPTGTDLKTITVTVTDNGQSGAPPVNDFKNVIASTDVTVNNVAPSNTGSTFTFNPYTGAASASISFSDPGLLDPVTATWAGLVPTTPTTLAAPRLLTGAFGASNTFEGTGCFATPISVTVSDDDTGSFSYQFAAANTLGKYTASFMAPIKDGARNIVKLGNVIPVKIRVLDCHGNPVLNRTLTVWLVSGIIDAHDIEEGDLTVASSVSAADTGNQMRVADSQYIFNLATKGLQALPFTIVIRDTATGTLNIATAAIDLKK